MAFKTLFAQELQTIVRSSNLQDKNEFRKNIKEGLLERNYSMLSRIFNDLTTTDEFAFSSEAIKEIKNIIDKEGLEAGYKSIISDAAPAIFYPNVTGGLNLSFLTVIDSISEEQLHYPEDPEDKKEVLNKFLASISYLVGECTKKAYEPITSSDDINLLSVDETAELYEYLSGIGQVGSELEIDKRNSEMDSIETIIRNKTNSLLSDRYTTISSEMQNIANRLSIDDIAEQPELNLPSSEQPDINREEQAEEALQEKDSAELFPEEKERWRRAFIKTFQRTYNNPDEMARALSARESFEKNNNVAKIDTKITSQLFRALDNPRDAENTKPSSWSTTINGDTYKFRDWERIKSSLSTAGITEKEINLLPKSTVVKFSASCFSALESLLYEKNASGEVTDMGVMDKTYNIMEPSLTDQERDDRLIDKQRFTARLVRDAMTVLMYEDYLKELKNCKASLENYKKTHIQKPVDEIKTASDALEYLNSLQNGHIEKEIDTQISACNKSLQHIAEKPQTNLSEHLNKLESMKNTISPQAAKIANNMYQPTDNRNCFRRFFEWLAKGFGYKSNYYKQKDSTTSLKDRLSTIEYKKASSKKDDADQERDEESSPRPGGGR